MSHSPATPAAVSNICSVMPIKLPIGTSDFWEVAREGFTFADKSLLIEELIQGGAKVTLIARPRRFGKTLNLSMLHHFFAAQAYGRPTRGLFDGLAVAGRPAVMAHQGQYPVIFFSFKDIKVESFEAFENTVRVIVAALCNSYPELLDSPRLSASDRSNLQELLTKEAGLGETASTFRLLSELLHKHYGQRVVILLDEYDTPLHTAFTHGFYEPVIGFMRNLLGAALKDNPYLFKSVITGIMRISKESLFSDLNNIEVHTVLDEGYSQYFGFTEVEVSDLLRTTGLARQQPALEAQIKDWYNGYRFGPQVIYNPWSIINCLKQGGSLRPHWVNTSGNALLKKLMAQADVSFKEGLERLIRGESIREIIDPNLVFGDLTGNSTALWSLLLFSGYLTASNVQYAEDQVRCELAIPNWEIRSLYEGIIRRWFTDPMSAEGYRSFLHSLVSGNVADFEARLRDYLFESLSFFDAHGRHPEKFYHGLVLGLIASLRDTHVIYSNRESGRGRYDVALFPKAAENALGVLMEFKQVSNPAELQAAADAAVAQIDAKKYSAELRQYPVTQVLALGLAFAGKEMALRSRFDRLG